MVCFSTVPAPHKSLSQQSSPFSSWTASIWKWEFCGSRKGCKAPISAGRPRLPSVLTCVASSRTRIVYLALHACRPFTISFRKTRLESEWNTTFWGVPAEDFREQRNIWKGIVLFFPGRNVPKLTKIRVPSRLQSYLTLPRPLFGKWNWFEQMVNAIPVGYLSVLNFA